MHFTQTQELSGTPNKEGYIGLSQSTPTRSACHGAPKQACHMPANQDPSQRREGGAIKMGLAASVTSLVATIRVNGVATIRRNASLFIILLFVRNFWGFVRNFG